MAEETEVAEIETTSDAPPRPEAVSELAERFVRGLDKIAPLPKKTPVSGEEAVQPPTPSQEQQPPPPERPESPLPPPKPREPERKQPPPPRDEPEQLLPSFLEKPAPLPSEPPKEELELPEVLPGTTTQKQQSNWQQLRESWKSRGSTISQQSARIAELEAAVGKDTPATAERVKKLEEENARLLAVTERVALQEHPRFQAEILQPRANALAYAKSIVKDAGGDPAALDRAVALTGQAHYAALEELYSQLPEVAKGELSAVIKDIRLYDRRRDQVLADPKRSMDAIRKEDLVFQQRQLEQQQIEGDKMLERILTRMREVNKVEVLQRSADPKDKWWNDQVDLVENTARQLARTHDPEQLMAALALAPMADVYRRLFLDSQKEINRLKQRVVSFESHEPTTDGEATPVTPKEQTKKELEKPIGQAFREILQRNRNRQ